MQLSHTYACLLNKLIQLLILFTSFFCFFADGNVNYEEFVTMLLHKKPNQEDKAGSLHGPTKRGAASIRSKAAKPDKMNDSKML